MPVRQNYNTKARKYILDYLSNAKDGTVGASDIIRHLEDNGISVNQATVYRFLNKLTREKKLLKFTDKESQKSVYRLIGEESNCKEHLHIKCTECGRLMHLDCSLMGEIRNHLFKDHGFTLKCDGSILYGICEKCKNKDL